MSHARGGRPKQIKGVLVPPIQGRARRRGGGGRPAAPAGEVVSTAAGGTGQSESVRVTEQGLGVESVDGRRPG
jgi:hypothetical protein